MKITFFSFAIILTAFLFSCSNENVKDQEVSDKDSAACDKPAGLNPNGDSELALMMREMVTTTQAIHDSVEAGKALPSYPEHFGKIFFLKKTDSTINKEVFNSLAENYLKNIKFFYDSPEKDRKKNFNGMVNSCISCHENFCHGPIKRIRKFLVQE